MGKYNGAVITAAGQNLIAQAIAESKAVTFTTAQVSSHVYPSSTDFEALTALTDIESTVNINYAGVYSDTVVQVSARFDNDGVDTAYLINTLGFFAQLGTDAPILFAVCAAVTPDQMPVYDADNPSAFIYNMQITVQNADSVTVDVNPAGTVTVEQLNTAVSDIEAEIGDITQLDTADKSSTVGAINELVERVDKCEVLVVSIPSFSSLPQTVSNVNIESDMVVVNSTLGTPSAQTGDWSVNTSAGSVTVAGSISGSTTLTLYLSKSR